MKFFQQQNFVSSEFKHRIYPWPLAPASSEKRWRQSFFRILTCFSLQLEFNHFVFRQSERDVFFRCVRRLGFFEHGCLCEVNVLIYRRRICRSEICRRVWAHRVFMYTDFSAIKEKGISACRQYFLSFALNRPYWPGLYTIFSSVLSPLIYRSTRLHLSSRFFG